MCHFVLDYKEILLYLAVRIKMSIVQQRTLFFSSVYNVIKMEKNLLFSLLQNHVKFNKIFLRWSKIKMDGFQIELISKFCQHSNLEIDTRKKCMYPCLEVEWLDIIWTITGRLSKLSSNLKSFLYKSPGENISHSVDKNVCFFSDKLLFSSAFDLFDITISK